MLKEICNGKTKLGIYIIGSTGLTLKYICGYDLADANHLILTGDISITTVILTIAGTIILSIGIIHDIIKKVKNIVKNIKNMMSPI